MDEDIGGKRSEKIREQKTVHDSVNTWINSQGYPLEFKTARILKKCGLATQQGIHISDNGNAREIDVIANKVLLEEFSVCFEYIIECKNISEKPWIIFDSEDYVFSESYHFRYISANILAARALRNCLETYDFKRSRLFTFPTGFGITSMTNSGKDNSYNSVQSVCGNTLLRKELFDRIRNEKSYPIVSTISVPLIVVEGNLFRATYDDTLDTMIATEVNTAKLLWNGSNKTDNPIIVDVVNVRFLENYINERIGEIDSLLAVVSTESIKQIAFLEEYYKFHLRAPGNDAAKKREKQVDDLLNNDIKRLS
ncbi:hypothetical protein [Deinococcus cellulosilyticus]|uniref:Restriction endonuclease n=1 Tax=Deinococcus cellulosilyticus (strain DSM 18568 / NBRC 106333 / KACC 11606 / 5516J-15) TaxID=1223518 RepID=A0A511MWR1_DEIC1|nr:hypothetical protein [Deinococcus cellulosilyticus]GEM44821.1 hypothetical protein DC3_04560 [Deinococcus cellulosilyticus NBRC 106333 = KACC 11606]